jgi:hypothetical protein
MHTITEQATIALTCYDEANHEKYVKRAFPLAVYHKRKTDTEFFGWIDHGNGLASVWMEGTHGENFAKKIVAWAGNLAASDNDNNGQHDGFQMIADMIFRLIGGYLLEYRTLYFFGHSRACAVLALLAYVIKKQKESIAISGRVFCPPPPGNRKFAKEFDALIPDWVSYVMEGDYINTGKMRNDGDAMLDGVDLGEIRKLPPVGIVHKIPLIRAYAHAPKRVCKSLYKMYKEPGLKDVERWCLK